MEVVAEVIMRALTKTEGRKLAACEKVIRQGLQTFFDVGNALKQIRDERLYRGEFKRFEDYCRERWDMASAHARRLVAAAETVEKIAPNGAKNPESSPAPQNEAQVRPLTSLPEDEQVEVWQEACEEAGGQPTGKLVAEVVRDARATGDLNPM